ncbi:type I polyketide synthase [Kitasatospora griseola]|uniref:type I polyketide synthase n=1 Tax=Kitasatospora griseola TaxID=2064 RepID=UPI00342181DA
MSAPPQQPPAPDGPVAIVGLACRFPGAPDRRAFWRLLAEGRDAVAPGTGPRAGRRPGGYLEDTELFDAELFGMSAREAAATDPQQRLLLELAWLALEDARIAPDALHGTDTGVFVGACADEHAFLARAAGPAALSAYTLTGTGRAFLANRLSYAFGLHGPCLVTDTGQSSSLVAVHQAVRSIRSGESTLALAAGVQLNPTAEGDAVVEALGALSPTGRCRTFDARADGIVRGEGAAVLVLKPLARALADGDRIYCTVLGGAVNNDGRGAGLTAPGQQAQQRVLAAAYADAGVDPRQVGHVELHGTGTRSGDPVEAAALGAVLGAGRPADRPLLVGSVKTNIGHLEGAAGLAGLVKTALGLHHGELPPSLHYTEPNPAIDPAALGLAVCRTRTAWPGSIAGVSSFGLGGTNCHVVLGAAPTPVAAPDPAPVAAPDPAPAPDRPDRSDRPAGPVPLVLSGHTPAALRGQALRLAAHLSGARTADPAALGLSLAVTRAGLRHRAAVVGAGPEELADGLRALARGEHPDGVRTGLRGTGGTVFLLPGQGMQRTGMGRELHGSHPEFAAAFDRVAEVVGPLLGTGLHEVAWRREDLLDRLEYAQPVLFALEVALYRLLESRGIVPDLLVGHSQGEITAAHLAGVLSLEDAAAFVVERGRLIASLPPGGAMVAVQAAEDEVREAIAEQSGLVGVAAVNSDRSLVVSGAEEPVLALAARFAALGRRTRPLRISRAGHSPLMAPIQDELRAFAEKLTFHRASGPVVVSAVTGAPAGPEELGSAAYWAHHLCATVRFGDAVRAAHALGGRFFVEVGPGHGLSTMAEEVAGGGAEVFAAPLATAEERRGLAELAAAAHVFGRPVDWRAYFGPAVAPVDLPGYAFQRLPYRLADAAAPAVEPAAQESAEPAGGDPADLVPRHTLEILGRPAGAPLDFDASFNDLGLDSRAALALCTRLSRDLGRKVPATVLFDHPTPARLIEALRAAAPSQSPRASHR